MYTDFYNLKEKPFDLSPSPRFLYLGEVHKEALALLTYGVTERKGFILLTGEVGTGKSTMIQALLAGLEDDVQYVYISNPLFSPQDFMNYLASKAFNTRLNIKSKAEFLITFEDFLKERLRDQKNFALIIDEAQKLSFELLEEIRLLSNMETADKKLISILLVGQPELNEKLSKPMCRPLLQRISVRYHIRPLDLEDSQEYITTRLKIAGSENGYKIFTKSVIKTIYQCSQGFPRLINILADNALLLGYSREKRKLTPAIVRECYEDMGLEGSTLDRIEESKDFSKAKQVAPASSGRYWKWAVVVFVILAMVFVNTQKGQDIIKRTASFIPVRFQGDRGEVASRQVIPAEEVSEVKGREEVREDVGVPVKMALKDEKEPEETIKKTGNKEDATDSSTMKEEALDQSVPLAHEHEQASWTTIIVKEGDTLAEMATRHYGRVDHSLLDTLKKNNPEITNINLIRVGQKVVLPPASGPQQGPTYTVHIASFKPFRPARELFQKLMKEGYEAYILPRYDPQKGKIFRVTLGNFVDPKNAQDYAAKIQENKVSGYARVMRVEMK